LAKQLYSYIQEKAMEEVKLMELVMDSRVHEIIESKDHLELAKFLGREFCDFTTSDEKYIDIFWESTFNQSWLYVSEEMVHEQLGYTLCVQMLSNFFRKLSNDFELGTDYAQVENDYPIVKSYYSSMSNGKSVGNRKKHFIITGETYKALLSSANTQQGKLTRKYFIKVERLADMTQSLIHLYEAKVTIDNRSANVSVANTIFDEINHAFTFDSKHFRTFIVGDEAIWFNGKDIATILEYKNISKALADNVRPKNKSPLGDLIDKSKGNWQLPLVGNEKASIYIDEPGLYQLIMKSKMKAAEQFQDYVYEVVLPSIRRMGQEKFMQQLAVQNMLLEEHKELLEQKDSQLNRLHRINAELLTHKKLQEKNESIYLVSTEHYVTQGLIKVGRTKNIKARSSSHNTTHIAGDKVKVLHKVKVNDSALVESIIHKKLAGLRPEKASEFFMCPFNQLREIVDMIIEYDNLENERVNILIDAVYLLKQREFSQPDWTAGLDMNIFSDTSAPEVKSIEPPTNELEQDIKQIDDSDEAMIQLMEITKFGYSSRVKFNITKCTDEQKNAFIDGCIQSYYEHILVPQQLAALVWTLFQQYLLARVVPKNQFKSLTWRAHCRNAASQKQLGFIVTDKK
jgi:prophage antirepressor-like protein/phage anti-repressor protein